MTDSPTPDPRTAKRGSYVALVGLAGALLMLVALVALLMHNDAAEPDAVPPAPTFIGADGYVAINAVGYADSADATALRADARRQLVEKAAGLYMVGELLDFRYALIEEHLLAQADRYLQGYAADAPHRDGGGLTALPARASVNAHAVRAALKEIGRTENLRLVRFDDADEPRIERVRLRTLALPEGVDTALLREFAALRNVLAVTMTRPGSSAHYVLDLNGGISSEPIGLIAETLLGPLQAKFGRNCLGVNSRQDNEITLAWDAACNHPDILARIEALPPAALLNAPLERRAQAVSDPERRRLLGL